MEAYTVNRRSVNGKQYCLTNIKATGFEARDECTRGGGHLPTFFSTQDLDTLQSVLQAHYDTGGTYVGGFWIALTHETGREWSGDPIEDGRGYYQQLSDRKMKVNQTLRDVFSIKLQADGTGPCFHVNWINAAKNKGCNQLQKLVCEIAPGKL